MRKLTLILAILGVLITGYLTYAHVVAASVPCPADGPTNSCSSVLHSKHSTLFNAPVAVFGLLAYLFILVMLYKHREKKVKYISYAALLGVFAAGYFNYIMLFSLEQICIWCESSHTVMSLLFLINSRHKIKTTVLIFISTFLAGSLLAFLLSLI